LGKKRKNHGRLIPFMNGNQKEGQEDGHTPRGSCGKGESQRSRKPGKKGEETQQIWLRTWREEKHGRRVAKEGEVSQRGLIKRGSLKKAYTHSEQKEKKKKRGREKALRTEQLKRNFFIDETPLPPKGFPLKGKGSLHGWGKKKKIGAP